MSNIQYQAGDSYAELGLALDAKGYAKLQPAEVLSITQPRITTMKLDSAAISKLYRKELGEVTEIAFTYAPKVVLINEQDTGEILFLPRRKLELVQTSLRPSPGRKIFFIKTPGIDYGPPLVSTEDFITGLPGPFEFALTQKGIYSTSLTVQDQNFFWVRSVLAKVGKMQTTRLLLTYSLFL